MSASINPNVMKHFFISKVGSELTANEAKKLGIENEFDAAAESLDVDALEIEDVFADADLYEQFATLYTTEKEKEANAKDKEQEKEEQIAVKDKNGAGV